MLFIALYLDLKVSARKVSPHHQLCPCTELNPLPTPQRPPVPNTNIGFHSPWDVEESSSWWKPTLRIWINRKTALLGTFDSNCELICFLKH